MHELSVVIASEIDSALILKAHAGACRVRGRGGWWLIPAQALLPTEALDVPDLEDPAAAAKLPEALASLLESLATLPLHAPIALAFTRYFGGTGAQAAAVLDRGKLLLAPVVGSNAINEALALAGVQSLGGQDLFDSVGLSQWRSMDTLMKDAG